MDSSQSVVSTQEGSSVLAVSEKRKANVMVEKSGILSRETDFQGKETSVGDLDKYYGVLDIYINEARDIHNICIYQNQDVYAKFCMTNDPENSVFTKIINGGGRNPVFDENLRLSVRKVDSSLKCEIWMLSRVRNYLEDQLLGFALIPVSDILLHNRKLEKELSLSSTDLFHSQAGFVQLAVSYIGPRPEVIPIPAPLSAETDYVVQDAESVKPLPCDLEKIEFPDPKVENENRLMVGEYFALPCTPLDSQNSNSLASADLPDSPPGVISRNRTSSVSLAASSESHEIPKASISSNGENPPPPKDNLKGTNANNINSESKESAGCQHGAGA